MKYAKIQKELAGKFFFSTEDVAGILKIAPGSARVLCSRYVKNGFFIRLKKNFYVLERNWTRFQQPDFLKMANFLQVPSYVSFTTALSFYGVTTQVQRDFFESASVRRSVKLNVREAVFGFYKLKKQLYFDFTKESDVFIATKEKAFIDSVYLYSLGRYRLDFAGLDLDKLDKTRIKMIVKIFPEKTIKIVKKLCGI